MKSFLLTGFGPFESFPDNPSGKLAASLGLPHEVLPVSYGPVADWALSLSSEPFQGVIMLGASPHVDRLTLELLARNRTERNGVDGAAWPHREIEPGAPRVLGTTLWSPDLIAAIEPDGRFGLGFDAGDYLCNFIYYQALWRHRDFPAGFIHIPSEERMCLSIQREALQHLIELAGARPQS